MPADNVTPFRRPPQKRPVAPKRSGGFGLNTHRGKAVLAHVLTLVAFGLAVQFRTPPLSAIALLAAIAAFFFVYSNRGAGMPWANTHHEHALRTLAIGFAITMLTDVVLSFVVTSVTIEGVRSNLILLAFWTSIAVAVWACVRALIGFALAIARKAIQNPRGWLV